MKSKPQFVASGVGATWLSAARSLAMAALLALAATASAQTNGTWTGADGATWDTSATNWSGVTGTPWASPGTTANATFNATSGSASVSGTVFANTITYSPVGGNFSIANGTITLAGTTPTINNYDPTGTLTLSSRVAGSAGLISRGAGTLVLAGNNTYTGTTQIRGGLLMLDYSGLSNTADPLSTGAVTLDMGTLVLKGKSSGSTSETISTLNMGANLATANTLRLDNNGGSGIALTVSTFVMNTTAANVQNINLFDLSSSGSNSITVGALGTGTAVANGVIMGNSNRANLVVRDSSGYGFATLSGTTLGRLSTGTTLDATNTSSTTNYRLTNAGTLTRAANLDYSTITLDSTAGAVTLDMGANNLAPSGNGRGILITGANDVSITGTGRLEGQASTWFHNYSTGTFTYGLSTAASTGASLMFGGSGLTVWTGTAKTTGADSLYIEGGIFRPTAAQNWTSGGINGGGAWVSSGAVLEVGADLNGATAGDLSNQIGASTGQIRLWGNSGVSAFGGDRIVGFRASGSLQSLTWGGTSFLTDAGGSGDGNYVFKLSSNRSDSTVTVENAIALGSLNRTVEVANGSAATDAILSGVLSGAGGLVKSGAGALTLSGNNTYSGSTMISAGTLEIGSTGRLGGGSYSPSITNNGTFIYSGANQQTLSGNISGSGALTQNASSTLILSSNNTYTGATTINAGTLQIGAGSTTGSISSSSAITNNGTLAINRSDAITLSNTISGTGNLTKLGTNTLTLNGSSANTYNGTTTVSAGNLTLDKTSGVVAVGGDLVLNGSSKLLYGSSKNEQIANTASITLNGSQSVFNGSTWNRTDGTQASITETIGSLMVRDGQFNVGGGGNWTVTGAGVFDGSTGDTRFVGNSGSRISFNSLSLTAMTGTTIVSSPDGFVMGGASTTAVTTLSVGSGGLTLNASTLGLNKGTPSTSQLGSRLILDGNITTIGSSASSIASNNGTVGISNILLSEVGGSVVTRTITTGSGADLTISVPITNGNATTGGIIKDGLGTLTLNGTNTYTGATTLNSGTLSIAAITNGGVAGALGNSTNDAGNLVLGGGTLEYTGTVDGTTNRDFTLTAGTTSGISVANSTVSLTISGAAAATNGGLTKSGAGTLILSGANAYTGDTTITVGTLEIASGGRLGGGSYSASITNNGTFIYSGANSQTFSGIISGTGNLTKSGAGTLNLSNANTYQGTTTINAGAINLTGSNTASATTINSGGTLIGTGTAGAVTVNTGGLIGAGNAAATPGTLTVGSLTLNGGGGYTWDLSNTSGAPGINWDLITATSTTIGATSGDKFTIFLTGNPTNWSPATTYSAGWNILQWGTLNSVFDSNAFTVNTNNFTGATPTGTWAFSSIGGFLNLSYAAPSSAGIWTAAGGNWSTASNWQGNAVPSNVSPLEFSGSGGVSTNDSALTAIAGITFNSGAGVGSYTLDGTALTITGGITNNSTNSQTVAIALTMGGAQTFSATAANLTISGNLANNANTLTTSGSNTVAISGNISGAGGLTKNGAGSLVLSGANTYTGATVISDGTLVLNGSLSGTDITVSAANFTQASTSSISGAGKTFV
jgi:autotransporter-associated beta strand protein